MSAPNLAVQVEPCDSGKVAFLPMAPDTAGAKARGRVFLRLDITNLEPAQVNAQSVTISFPGSAVAPQTKNINMAIAAGQTFRWWFQQPQDAVVFDLPGPSTIKLAFQVQGFAQTADSTYPLAPHVSPVAGGAYHFPAVRADLALGEYWHVNGCTHGTGTDGSQSFGYDMDVWRPNHDDGTYSWLVVGGSPSKNSDYRVWGKPVHAMADGVVLQAIDDCPDNPVSIGPLLNGVKAHDDPIWKDQENKYWGKYEAAHGGFAKVHAGGGNHFYIQHGDEVVLYAHMQKGSLNKNLLATGSVVHAGDFLGLAGNAGNASNPHLHIHSVRGTAPEVGPLRPIILTDAWAIDDDLVVADPRQGLWSSVHKQGIPEGDPATWYKKDVFLWPDPSLPEWPEIVNLAVPEQDYQALFLTMTGRGFRPVWLDGFTIEPLPGVGQTYLNVIFRPATGVAWHAGHGLTGDEYQAEFDTWVKTNKYRLVHIESYFSYTRGQTAYAPIFEKSPGSAQAAYHGRTQAEHQALFEDLTKNQGYRPVNISVVAGGLARSYAGLYEKRNVGAFEEHDELTVDDYQKKFNDNVKAGRHLAYLNSYLYQGDIKIVAIWYQNLPSPFVQHHLDNQEFDAMMVQERKANLYLRCVTGYQRGFTGNWAAIWNV